MKRTILVASAVALGAFVSSPSDAAARLSSALDDTFGSLQTPLADGQTAPLHAVVVDCATDPARRCVAHRLDWAELPAAADFVHVIASARSGAGTTRLACTVASDETLTDCAVVGEASPAEEAAMKALADQLKADERTRDGLRSRGGKVLLVFDWAKLVRAANNASR